MYVRVLFGRYAGEVRDIESASARLMLEDGRAENPFAEFATGGEIPAVSSPLNLLDVLTNNRTETAAHQVAFRKKAKP